MKNMNIGWCCVWSSSPLCVFLCAHVCTGLRATCFFCETDASGASVCVRFAQLCSHVILPLDVAKLLPKGKLLSEDEWRDIGVEQSIGWVHYAIHRPEPHILLFRRKLEQN
jgi:cyclin-dependent kinase regulatory subunit CKS1